MKKLSQILKEAVGDAGTILVTMPEEGVLMVRRSKDTKWTEIRGEYNKEGSDFQRALDCLVGGHSSTLFAGDEVFLTPARDPQQYQVYDHILKQNELPGKIPAAAW